MTTEAELYEAEVEFLLEKVGRVALKQAYVVEFREGAWTGSHGGHDTVDFNKLKGGLKKWWIEKAHKDPHPFTYCVRHLSKHVANPERLCAWLKDQALGTTKWRKGSKSMKESAVWEPSLDELRAASAAFTEAEGELDEELFNAAEESTHESGAGDGASKDGGNAGAEGTEVGNQGTPAVPDPEAKPTGSEGDE